MKWKRKFSVHYRTLLEAVKSQKELKLYCFFLNLHSLYEEKTIHNYKTKTKVLLSKTGVSRRLFNIYLNELKAKGLVWEHKDNLQIGSIEKYAEYFKVNDYFDGLGFYQSKFIRIKRQKHLDKFELENYALRLTLERKRHALVTQLHRGRSIRKISHVERSRLESKLRNQLAEGQANIDLYLSEVKKLFGLDSIQAASYKLKQLSKKKLLQSHQQLVYLKKVNGGDRRIDNKTFIKNNWLIVQQPNRLVFQDPILEETWWHKIINDHQTLQQEIKAKKATHKLTDSIKYLSHKAYNNNGSLACISKKTYKKTYYDVNTGEVLAESVYNVFRNLAISGFNFVKKFVTPFIPIPKGISYTVIEEDITERLLWVGSS